MSEIDHKSLPLPPEQEAQRQRDMMNEELRKIFGIHEANLFYSLRGWGHFQDDDKNEVINDTFLAYEAAINKGDVIGNLGGWLYRVARNIASDKSRKMEDEKKNFGWQPISDNNLKPTEPEYNVDLIIRVTSAFSWVLHKKLPDSMISEVFRKLQYGHKSQQELADALGCAKSTICRTLEKLEDIIAGFNEASNISLIGDFVYGVQKSESTLGGKLWEHPKFSQSVHSTFSPTVSAIYKNLAAIHPKLPYLFFSEPPSVSDYRAFGRSLVSAVKQKMREDRTEEIEDKMENELFHAALMSRDDKLINDRIEVAKRKAEKAQRKLEEATNRWYEKLGGLTPLEKLCESLPQKEADEIKQALEQYQANVEREAEEARQKTPLLDNLLLLPAEFDDLTDPDVLFYHPLPLLKLGEES